MAETGEPADHDDEELDDPLGDPLDDLILAALSTGATQAEAAAASGVSERTVRRRMSDAEFARRVRQARGELIARLAGRLLDVAESAVDTLESALNAERDADRIRAAKETLVLALRFIGDVDFEERLRALESHIHELTEEGS